MATATAPSTDLLPEVKKFLATAPLKGVVGGKDVAGSDGKTMATLDPGSGEPIAESCSSTCSLAPPCSGPLSAPIAATMPECMSDPVETTVRAAKVEALNSCSA